MRISVRKGLNGRRLIRADRRLASLNYFYVLLDMQLPSVGVRLEGSDGVTYEINFTQEDINAINEARIKHAPNFVRGT